MIAGLTKKEFSSVLQKIFKNSDVVGVILFGSRAKGNFVAGSDIDLALLGDNLGVEELLEIHLDLDDLFLPYKFDLLIYDNIKAKDLLEHIDRVGVRFSRGKDF